MDENLLNELKKELPNLVSLIDKQDLNSYIKKVVNYSFNANKYFNDTQPWSLKKTDEKRMNTIIFTIVEQIKNISILLSPIIPIATSKTLNTLNVAAGKRNLDSVNKIDILCHDKELQKIEILFNKVEHDS